MNKITIHVYPEDAWEYFKANIYKLKTTMVEIASAEHEYDSKTTISKLYITEKGFRPELVFEIDGITIMETVCINETELYAQLEEIYFDYFNTEKEEPEKEKVITEDEMISAFLGFMDTILTEDATLMYYDKEHTNERDALEQFLGDIMGMVYDYGFSCIWEEEL